MQYQVQLYRRVVIDSDPTQTHTNKHTNKHTKAISKESKDILPYAGVNAGCIAVMVNCYGTGANAVPAEKRRSTLDWRTTVKRTVAATLSTKL